MIAAFFSSWDRFFYRKVPPHLLALVRIVFGLFLMLYWYSEWTQAATFSSKGLVVPALRFSQPFFLFLFYPPPWFVDAFFIAVFVCLTLFTIGLLFRTSTLVLLVFFIYFHVLTHYVFSTSFYRLYGFALIVFLFGGADRTFSVRMCWKRGSFFAWEPIGILPQRLFALQLSFTYFAVGWQKLFLPDWKTGAVLRNGFMGRWATPLAFRLVRLLPAGVFDILVAQVKVLECLMPFGFWVPRVRALFFVWGFFFHTIITLTLGIWWFQFLVPLYIVFLDPYDVYEYCRSKSRGRIA